MKEGMVYVTAENYNRIKDHIKPGEVEIASSDLRNRRI